MKLSFYGAAKQVTGSMYLLELEDGYRILIDCGTDLEGGKKNVPEESAAIFPFEPSMINLVLLTHAHIDHSGQIPNLYREGYEGQVLCTEPTLELSDLLLQDSANLHLQKLRSLEKKKSLSKKGRALKSSRFYLSNDVRQAIDNFVPLAYGRRFKFKEDGWVTFIPAGHLLGAAHILIEVMNNGQLEKICFSGDIGRHDYPLLPDPEVVPAVDYLICETTYGNRQHTDDETPEEKLAEIIKASCVDIPGRLLIPSFSVGRTQALLFTLNKLYENGMFKPIKVFTDSPLAKNSTKVYEKYSRYLNSEAREMLRDDEQLFDFENLIYLQSNKASEEIAFHSEPCIIVSSSGMIQGGRIENHVSKNIENPYATILFIGYATEGTLGHKIRSKELKEVVVQGAVKNINAKIITTDVFSGHGDLNDLLRFVEVQKPERLKKLFLVHGDIDSMLNFKTVLEDRKYNQVEIPEWSQTFEL